MNCQLQIVQNKLKELQVSGTGILKVQDIPFDASLRQSCEMNTCGCYGKNWACPPLVGKIEDLITEAKQYEIAVVFQNIYSLEDSFDIEGMNAAKKEHEQQTLTFRKWANQNLKQFLLLGAGGCQICKECTAVQKNPCRHPEWKTVSLEAYGVFVSELASRCGLNYINGANTVTYFSMLLLP